MLPRHDSCKGGADPQSGSRPTSVRGPRSSIWCLDLGGYHLVWPRDLVETAGGHFFCSHDSRMCRLPPRVRASVTGPFQASKKWQRQPRCHAGGYFTLDSSLSPTAGFALHISI